LLQPWERSFWNVTRYDCIFQNENPSVWQIPMFSQIFPMRNMGWLCAKLLENMVYCCLNIPCL
jgi:hypothetical protein